MMEEYKTRYVLKYCNPDGIPLRIDLKWRNYVGGAYVLVDEDYKYLLDNDGQFVIVEKSGEYDPDTDVSNIEGTSNPFTIKYLSDKGSKASVMRATSANLSFFENNVFNIDDMMTSDETEILAVFSYNNEVEWMGFIIPDFFTNEITANPVVALTATDRLGVIKDIQYPAKITTIEDRISYLNIIVKCLKSTSLRLNINVLCDFKCDEWDDGSIFQNAFMKTYVNEGRFVSSNNKTESVYEVLRGILNQFNCFLTQYKGEWWIVNKEQRSKGVGKVTKFDYEGNVLSNIDFIPENIEFSLIDTGGQRTIIPVNSINTLLLDHGQTMTYPINHELVPNDIAEFPYWTIENTSFPGPYIFASTEFLPSTYNSNGSFNQSTLYKASRKYLVVKNRQVWGIWLDLSEPRLASTPIKVVSPNALVSNIEIEVSTIGKPGTDVALVIILDTKRVGHPDRYVVLRQDDQGVFWGTIEYRNGFPNQIRAPLNLSVPSQTGAAAIVADDQVFKFSTKVKKLDTNIPITNMEIFVYIYGTSNQDGANESIVKYVRLYFNSDDEVPKGTVYQSTVDGVFTKRPENETVMFGDYEETGKNGFFYPYQNDSLSIQYNQQGKKTKNWSTITDPVKNPLLLHAIRQRTRQFGKAHNELNMSFDCLRINPMASFKAKCNQSDQLIGKYIRNKAYEFVEGEVDYLRGTFKGILSESTINDVESEEFIYSYFEESDIS